MAPAYILENKVQELTPGSHNLTACISILQNMYMMDYPVSHNPDLDRQSVLHDHAAQNGEIENCTATCARVLTYLCSNGFV